MPWGQLCFYRKTFSDLQFFVATMYISCHLKCVPCQICHRCAEQEAGYILLGSLICSWEGAGEEAAGCMAMSAGGSLWGEMSK